MVLTVKEAKIIFRALYSAACDDSTIDTESKEIEQLADRIWDEYVWGKN
jgi:hypothetical protein